jgi:GNAT superfamily N-acetyltransferase
MDLKIRDIERTQWSDLGRLMVGAYGRLEGFPTLAEQPHYYELLSNIGRFTEREGVRVLVAVGPDGALIGGIVYFGDMAQYGSGGTATMVRNASGIRLLGVDPRHQGAGVGKALAKACIQLAREAMHVEVILHTTRAMTTAWGMYERLGFQRSPDLDFLQESLEVFGFRLKLQVPKEEVQR